MAAVNIELYEALRKTLDEDAARMIAEVVPASGELVTKSYLDQRFAQFEAKFFRWILALFMPLWMTVLAALVAVVLKA